MKQYISLGELLIDYREDSNLSQTDFASAINVDTRTVQRWENDTTLIKSDKEEEIVLETLLPYQLIRNLNAAIVIPTFYDFKVRKYSLTKRSNTLPNAIWFKEQLNITTKRIRPLNYKFDIDYIMRYLWFQKKSKKLIEKRVIEEAIRLLPELNLIISDDSGYYSGHSIAIPINQKLMTN